VIRRLLTVTLLLAAATSCGGEVSIYRPPPPPVVDNVEGDVDDVGDPPDFTTCSQGWFASYYNLPPTHPDVEPLAASLPGVDPMTLDWWDAEYIAFEKYDPSLEFGANWWPVDEGIEDDPAYYSVKWNAWLRAYDDSNVEMVLAASSDAWILLNDEVIASVEGSEEFEAITINRQIDSGVYPIEIRFTHRMGAAGFRFRVANGDVLICFPDFGE